MALGELYKPTGLALEQAQAALGIEDPWAVNVAWGCTNRCGYCYLQKTPLIGYNKMALMRFPKEDPVRLVTKQLDKGINPEGVFLCFGTDPFLPQNKKTTERLIAFLLNQGIAVATSSKMGISEHLGVRHGMTIISLDDVFCGEWEPNAPLPKFRIGGLRRGHDRGDFTWVSMEPCPPPTIWEQDIAELLSAISFVDLIIKGRWRYDKRASTEEARRAYVQIFAEVSEFCEKQRIEFYPKSETLNFLERRQRCVAREKTRGGNCG